jgi:hypothetical protein
VKVLWTLYTEACRLWGISVVPRFELASASPESLLKSQRFRFSQSRVEPENLHSNKFPRDADAAGVRTTLFEPLVKFNRLALW